MKNTNELIDNTNTVKKLKKIEMAKLLIDKNRDIFRCPICKESIIESEKNNLTCKNNHCFDISKKGYINLLNNKGKTIYSKSLFESRNKIYKSKLYDNLTKEIIYIIDKYTTNKPINYILDTGCGEGYYLNKLSEEGMLNSKCEFIGVDISKEGISLATREENNIIWSVSDLANLPFKNNSCDVILNILSPANYKEFNRCLAEEGVIVKVIPEENYLKEIRNEIQKEIKNNDYSNEQIVEVFKENLEVIYEKRISYKHIIDKENLESLIRMTPLTSSLDEEQINKLIDADIPAITIDLRIIVGIKKSN